MIILVKGDLLLSDCNVLAHGCNCFNTMGRGVAGYIRHKYPEVYEADQKTISGDRKKLGTFTFSEIEGLNLLIFNLYSQYYYGAVSHGKHYLDYEALENALVAIKRFLQERNIYNSSKIGMPKIGCGLAGGNWNRVQDILNKVFDDKEIYIYYM